MKRIVYAAVALSMVAVAAPLNIAAAADMAVKAPTWGPAPVGLWDGLFFGGNVGYAYSSASWCTDATVTNCGGAAPLDVASTKPTGVIAGGQVGYRFIFGNFMFGPEALLDGMTIHGTATDPGGIGHTTTFAGMSSVTGDAGFTFDRFLAYGKGGWALTRVDFDAKNQGLGVDIKGSDFVQGWTAGGGLEYMLPSGWSIGVEYDYYRFNPDIVFNANAAGPCGFCNFGNQTNVQTILARLNIRIGPMPTTR